jgi:microcompartment protein CcmL/EutN
MGNEQKGNGGVRSALGLIETRGRAPLIEAVDSAIKAANVTLKTSYFVGGGINAVTLVGDVGAMRAALDAARAIIERFGVDGKTHLIPRLAPEVWPILEEPFIAPVPAKAAPGKHIPPTAAALSEKAPPVKVAPSVVVASPELVVPSEEAAPVEVEPPTEGVPPTVAAPSEVSLPEGTVPPGVLFAEEVLKEKPRDIKEEKPYSQPRKPRKRKR